MQSMLPSACKHADQGTQPSQAERRRWFEGVRELPGESMQMRKFMQKAVLTCPKQQLCCSVPHQADDLASTLCVLMYPTLSLRQLRDLSLLTYILGHARPVAAQTPAAACALTHALQRRRRGDKVCRVRHLAICGVQLRGRRTTLGACAGLHGDVWLQRRGGVHRQPARINTLHPRPRRLHVCTKQAHVSVGGCIRQDNNINYNWLRQDAMLFTLAARQYNAVDSKIAQCTTSSASAGAGPRRWA